MLYPRNLVKHRDRFSPPRILAIAFAVVIFIGSLLLYIPAASVHGQTDYIDCLFTSVSAVCVTGLITVDTGTHWTTLGHVIILLLIQVGGLGIMAFATMFALLAGSRINLKHRIMLQKSFNISSLGGVVKITRYLLLFTIVSELIGALVLWLYWWPEMGAGKAAWFGLFHSVSAFNGAGLELFGNYASLTAFQDDVLINMVISSLFMIGGLGFYVSYELVLYYRTRKLSLHSQVILLTTGILVAGGTVVLLMTEWNHAFQDMPLWLKLMTAYFHAVTPRSAGFHTIDLNTMYLSSQFFILLMMFIGASPGSTAGGIKTTTVAIVFAAIWSQLKGRRDCEILKRRIEASEVIQAMTIIAAYGGLMLLSSFLVSLTHQGDLMEVVFEVSSALGTVGLSLGLTAKLSFWGKAVIIATMFLGRIGPMTLGFALASKQGPSDYRYPRGRIMVG